MRYYVSPPGKPPPGLPVVYRDRLSVVTRDDDALPFARIVRAGQAPQAARVISREPDRIVIAPPGPGRLVVADLVYPGWKVAIDGQSGPGVRGGRPARGRGSARSADGSTWAFTPPGVPRRRSISLARLAALLGLALVPCRLRRAASERGAGTRPS